MFYRRRNLILECEGKLKLLLLLFGWCLLLLTKGWFYTYTFRAVYLLHLDLVTVKPIEDDISNSVVHNEPSSEGELSICTAEYEG